jgi:hypothetical protein
MSFVLAFERAHRVLWAKATGVIATQDLIDLDMASISFLAREERADGPPIRGLYDFSEMSAIVVPQTKAAARGSRSAIVRGQRVMVKSRTATCGIVETFTQSQRLAGSNLLAVVDSLAEAHALLGLSAPRFEFVSGDFPGR